MKGATCYEYQWGRIWLRILRPRYWRWPYRYPSVAYRPFRPVTRWSFPKYITWGVDKK